MELGGSELYGLAQGSYEAAVGTDRRWKLESESR